MPASRPSPSRSRRARALQTGASQRVAPAILLALLHTGCGEAPDASTSASEDGAVARADAGPHDAARATDALVAHDAAVTDAAVIDAAMTDAGPVTPVCTSVAPRPLSAPNASTGLVALADDGDGYLMVWEDETTSPTQLHRAHVDATGRATAIVALTETAAGAGYPALIAHAGGFAASFTTDRGQVVLMRLAPSGENLGETPLGDGSAFSSITATDEGFAVVYASSRTSTTNQIYLSRTDMDGRRIGTEVKLTDAPATSWSPAVLWTGGALAVAYQRDERLDTRPVFARYGLDGTRIGPEHILSAEVGSAVAMAASPSGYLAAWSSSVTTRMRQLRADGSPSSIEVFVRPSGPTDVAWSGARFGMVYGPIESPVMFTTLPSSSVLYTPPRAVGLAGTRGSLPRLIWDGEGWAIVWNQFDPASRRGTAIFTRVCG
jgi:hypothetical protein